MMDIKMMIKINDHDIKSAASCQYAQHQDFLSTSLMQVYCFNNLQQVGKYQLAP